eukprot:TRINITY_DN8502_c0_g1_i1.p1 TRINITY_DN8502_c0_g1~~TRINITY_DN8502_c0_g1_i1.p1  ORF type:complete len:699 (+),score=66.14 TRINITY_DN8502_c0_g1_i1:54-2150(+)
MAQVLLASLLCTIATGQGQQPGGAPPSESSMSTTSNVHVTFGDVTSCVAPACADFTIAQSDVIASLSGFTTYNGGTLATTSINYYGDWWNTNVGTSTAVESDFCISGAGASQTSSASQFSGVTYTAGSNQYSLGSKSTPNHDCENYCSAAGGNTPPLIGTTFTNSYTMTFSMTPSTKSRADISNNVGWAVNGVYIYSPFTGISTVAPYDETLDTCNGHPANGQYHYHGFSPCLHGETAVQTGSSISHSKIYGWAYDGFPIYGPYGYSDGSDSTSTVTRVTTGYACTSNGVACTTDAQRAVTANWAYSSSNGMLDDCNGRWTKTPEFPNGMYVYVLNINADGKPDFPGVPYCTQSTSTGTAAPTPTPTPSSSSSPVPTPTPTMSSTPGTLVSSVTLGGITFSAMKADSATSSFVTSGSKVTVTTSGRVYLLASSGLNSSSNGFRATITCQTCSTDGRVSVFMEAFDACNNYMQYHAGIQTQGNVKGWLYTCDYLRSACSLDSKSCDSPIGQSSLSTTPTTVGMWLKSDSQGTIVVEHSAGTTSGITSYSSPYIDADSAGMQYSGYGIMVLAGSSAISVDILVEGVSSSESSPQSSYTTAAGSCGTSGDPKTCTSSSPTPSPSSSSSATPSPTPSIVPSPSTQASLQTCADAAKAYGEAGCCGQPAKMMGATGLTCLDVRRFYQKSNCCNNPTGQFLGVQ